MLEEQKIQAAAWFRELRDLICAELERVDGGAFARKSWDRPGGGGGEMSVLKGNVIEKGGVNISTVHGEFSELMRKEVPGAAENPRFWASGISLVLHPRSPLVPAVHMNTRMVVVGDGRCWFGGGADLTPVFSQEADTTHFHGALKAACDAFDPAYYPKYKQWCDEYFYLKHRKETRGVGGIFYDYLEEGEWEQRFAFTKAVGKAFLDAYLPLVVRHKDEVWTPKQREAQLIKRGRYVEFNLLWDRGTRFGIMTDGNAEAILMSLPPEVKWE